MILANIFQYIDNNNLNKYISNIASEIYILSCREEIKKVYIIVIVKIMN